MSDIKTYRDKRTAAAEKYRLECLNAKGEVECSECGMAVPEPRANRNAQELAREKVRKLDNGPICNACSSSWRYSHHQDAEVEMANAQTDSIIAEDPNLVENAAFVYVGDEVKVKDDPGLWIVMDYDGGTYTLKGNNGIKKVRAEQIMRNAGAGHAYSCEACGHAYNDHKNPDDRSSQAVGPCSKCSCDQYKPRSGKSVVENASDDFRTSKEKRAAAAEAYRNESSDNKIMVHCDVCDKTFYEAPDGDGLCPDCKKKVKS